MLVVSAAGALVTVLVAALLVARVVHDVHRARSAADLGALAAAVPLVEGGEVDCAAAADVVAANGAVLGSCGSEPDGSVVVEAAVRLPGALADLGWAEASASARAGVVAGGEPARVEGSAPGRRRRRRGSIHSG